MIPYSLPEERKFILHYAKLLDDSLTEKIVTSDAITSKDEAIHLAEFFWRMVDRSNEEDGKNGDNSEYILEKIIITFMAYFRSSGYEGEWEMVLDKR